MPASVAASSTELHAHAGERVRVGVVVGPPEATSSSRASKGMLRPPTGPASARAAEGCAASLCCQRSTLFSICSSSGRAWPPCSRRASASRTGPPCSAG